MTTIKHLAATARRTASLALLRAGMGAYPTYAQSPAPPVERDPRQLLAEAAVKSRLKDPHSALFTWTDRWLPTTAFKFYRWSKPTTGEFSCGKLNVRWALGGYSGPTAFFVLIADGKVAELHMDFNPYGNTLGVAAARCRVEGF